MLARVEALDGDIAELDRKLEELIAPFAQAVERLDEIGGVGRTAAQVLLAEVGTDMGRFPPPGSWPGGRSSRPGSRKRRAEARQGVHRARQSLPGPRPGRGCGCRRQDRYLPGERYRRIARRRGTKRAIVAVGRSILVLVWHLLADPTARFCDLGLASTTPVATPSAASATTSASSRRSATRSPSNPPPDRHPPPARPHRHHPAPLRCAGGCRLPTHRGFSGQSRWPCGDAVRA
jgi:hypothetical protein